MSVRSLEPSEHQSQAAVIAWWAFACRGYGLPPFALMASVNGAHLAGDARGRAIKMANLKRAGLRPGVPDLFLAKPIVFVHQSAVSRHLETVSCGLWIEMKRKPNKPSAEQSAVILYLRERGYHCVVSYSSDEAIGSIVAYLRSPLDVSMALGRVGA